MDDEKTFNDEPPYAPSNGDDDKQKEPAEESSKGTISADLIRGHINTIILRTLDERDKYGYEIINEIEEKSHGQYTIKQPTLYSALKRLESQGYIKAYWKTDEVSSGGRRKYFTLTELGREFSEKNQSEWEYSRTVIDSLISDRSFDFSQPAPTPVDFNILKKSVTRVYTGNGRSEDGELTETDEQQENLPEKAEGQIDYNAIDASVQSEYSGQSVHDVYVERVTDKIISEDGSTHDESEKVNQESQDGTSDIASPAAEEPAPVADQPQVVEQADAQQYVPPVQEQPPVQPEPVQQYVEPEQPYTQTVTQPLPEQQPVVQQMPEQQYEQPEQYVQPVQEQYTQPEPYTAPVQEQQPVQSEPEQYAQQAPEQEFHPGDEYTELPPSSDFYGEQPQYAPNTNEDTEQFQSEENWDTRSEEEKRRTHENFLKLMWDGDEHEQGTVPNFDSIDTDKLIYTNRPETERDYKKLVDNIFNKTIKQPAPHEYGNIPEAEYAPQPAQQMPQPQQAAPARSYYPADPVVEKAKEDGLKVNASSSSSVRIKGTRGTTYNKGGTLFASSIVVGIIMLLEFIVCISIMQPLNVGIMYPMTILIIALAQLFIFGVMFACGFGRSCVRPTTHRYITLCIVLNIIAILIVCLVSFLINIDFNSVPDIAAKLIIPILTTLNITVFGVSYYFICK